MDRCNLVLRHFFPDASLHFSSYYVLSCRNQHVLCIFTRATNEDNSLLQVKIEPKTVAFIVKCYTAHKEKKKEGTDNNNNKYND